jgi:NADH:ubiquinone oxidoreductase subunit K
MATLSLAKLVILPLPPKKVLIYAVSLEAVRVSKHFPRLYGEMLCVFLIAQVK